MSSNQEAAKTREQQKKERTSSKRKTRGRVRIRLIPIWLRVIIVAVLIFLSLIAGAAVGYGVMGNGKASDVLKKSTWTHIIDLVEKSN